MSAVQKPSRAETSEASRDQILTVATELFSERGIAATAMDAVSRASGFSKPTIYWHFGSKQGLLAVVLERIGARAIEEIRKDVSGLGSPTERLDGMMRHWRKLARRDAALLRLPMMAALELGGQSEEVRESVRRIWQASERAIVEGIQANMGRELPELAPLGHATVTLLQGATLRYAVERDEAQLEANLEEIKRLITLSVVDRLRRADSS